MSLGLLLLLVGVVVPLAGFNFLSSFTVSPYPSVTFGHIGPGVMGFEGTYYFDPNAQVNITASGLSPGDYFVTWSTTGTCTVTGTVITLYQEGEPWSVAATLDVGASGGSVTANFLTAGQTPTPTMTPAASPIPAPTASPYHPSIPAGVPLTFITTLGTTTLTIPNGGGWLTFDTTTHTFSSSYDSLLHILVRDATFNPATNTLLSVFYNGALVNSTTTDNSGMATFSVVAATPTPAPTLTPTPTGAQIPRLLNPTSTATPPVGSHSRNSPLNLVTVIGVVVTGCGAFMGGQKKTKKP